MGLPAAPRRLARHSERPGRRPTLSLDAIVAAAIAVLDEAGVTGLSMRRVAEHLGTGAASLYGYVSGREELFELVYDELVGQVPLPTPDPEHWREQVFEMLRSVPEGLDVPSRRRLGRARSHSDVTADVGRRPRCW